MTIPEKDIKPTCRLLKAKNSFGMLESGGNFWHGVKDPSTQYWCVQTAGAIGPDNSFAGPEECVTGRKCFRPFE